MLHAAKRYTVSKARRADRRGELPGARREELQRRADAARQAPGPQAGGDIASGRKTVKPGATAKVTLRLSSAARRALARRSLTATLTLAGAKPATVQPGAVGTISGVPVSGSSMTSAADAEDLLDQRGVDDLGRVALGDDRARRASRSGGSRSGTRG